MKSSLKFLFSLFLAAGSLTAFAASYTDGIEYFKAGQPDRAKILLERTLDDAGTNKAESYYYLGEIAFGNKDYTTAAEYYKKGLTEDPLYAYNIVGQGKLALTGSDKEAAEKEAEKYFKEALKGKNKKDAGINLAIAKAYYETGTPGYEEYMKKSYKADKKYPDYFMFEGDVLVDQQKYGDACGRYENAIYFDPNCIEAYVKYSHIYFDINPRWLSRNSRSCRRSLPTRLLHSAKWPKPITKTRNTPRPLPLMRSICRIPTTSRPTVPVWLRCSSTASAMTSRWSWPKRFWLTTPRTS